MKKSSSPKSAPDQVEVSSNDAEQIKLEDDVSKRSDGEIADSGAASESEPEPPSPVIEHRSPVKKRRSPPTASPAPPAKLTSVARAVGEKTRRSPSPHYSLERPKKRRSPPPAAESPISRGSVAKVSKKSRRSRSPYYSPERQKKRRNPSPGSPPPPVRMSSAARAGGKSRRSRSPYYSPEPPKRRRSPPPESPPPPVRMSSVARVSGRNRRSPSPYYSPERRIRPSRSPSWTRRERAPMRALDVDPIDKPIRARKRRSSTPTEERVRGRSPLVDDRRSRRTRRSRSRSRETSSRYRDDRAAAKPRYSRSPDRESRYKESTKRQESPEWNSRGGRTVQVLRGRQRRRSPEEDQVDDFDVEYGSYHYEEMCREDAERGLIPFDEHEHGDKFTRTVQLKGRVKTRHPMYSLKQSPPPLPNLPPLPPRPKRRRR